MNSCPKFGACLNLMLSALHIKRSSLARFLNVDASLVSRWIHGKRVPSYRSNYIDLISQYISSNILNSFHHQQLEDILESICGNTRNNPDMYHKIKTVLLEAQGNSIETEKSMEQGKRIASLPSEALHLNKASSFYSSEEAAGCECTCGIEHKAESPGHQDLIIPLCTDDKIITGVDKILGTYMEMLDAASLDSGISDKDVIYICVNNDAGLFSQTQKLRREWAFKLYGVLKSGRSIVLLLGLGSNLEKLARLMELFIPLFATGRFNISYFKRYDSVLEGREIITIPRIGCLSCYFTKTGMSLASHAFFFKTPKPQEVITSYINSILASSCKPLISYSSFSRAPHTQREPGKPEKLYGSRYIYSDSLKGLLRCHKNQLDSLKASAACFRQKDIYTIESINSLIDLVLCPGNHCSDEPAVYKTYKDVIRHMSGIVDMLKICENYEVALIGRSNMLSRLRILCTINENHCVHMEITDSGNHRCRKSISLNEPMTVKAYEVYFKELWESAAPINRDKAHVIKWFEDKISLLSRLSRL